MAAIILGLAVSFNRHARINPALSSTYSETERQLKRCMREKGAHQGGSYDCKQDTARVMPFFSHVVTKHIEQGDSSFNAKLRIVTYTLISINAFNSDVHKSTATLHNRAKLFFPVEFLLAMRQKMLKTKKAFNPSKVPFDPQQRSRFYAGLLKDEKSQLTVISRQLFATVERLKVRVPKGSGGASAFRNSF